MVLAQKAKAQYVPRRASTLSRMSGAHPTSVFSTDYFLLVQQILELNPDVVFVVGHS